MEPKRMKSDQVRVNWTDVLDEVQHRGGIIIIERYTKTVAALVPAALLDEVDRLRAELAEADAVVGRLSARLDTYDDAALAAAAEQDKKNAEMERREQ